MMAVGVFLSITLQLLLVAPLLLIAWFRSPRRRLRFSLAAIALLYLDEFLVGLPWVGPFRGLHWNWQGKLASILWVMTLLMLPISLSRREVGFSKPEAGSLSVPVLVMVALACFPSLLALLLGGRMPVSGETILYELTMPGIAEELVYRGVLLALFDKAFGRPWRVFGANMGWGICLVTVLFTASHIFSQSADGNMVINREWIPILFITSSGFIFAWLRERTGSLVPCIFAHAAENGLCPLDLCYFPKTFGANTALALPASALPGPPFGLIFAEGCIRSWCRQTMKAPHNTRQRISSPRAILLCGTLSRPCTCEGSRLAVAASLAFCIAHAAAATVALNHRW